MALITWNPLDKGTNVDLSNNNLTATGIGAATTGRGVRATKGKSSGKWYFEVFFPTQFYQNIGLVSADQSVNFDMSSLTPLTSCRLFEPYRGIKPNSVSGWSASYTTGDGSNNQTIGIKLDLDVGTLSFFRNGIFLGIAFSDLLTMSLPLYPFAGTGESITVNFGATPFNIITTNLTAWNQLIDEGYQPYDVENATWLVTYKSLVKLNNQLYSLDQDYNFIPVASPTLENFQTYGLNSLNGLVIPKTKINYKMNQLGDGISSKTIIPEKWWRSIQGLEIK